MRVYCDGCFDMMHYGHANALRQAKALGDVLVVGVVPDSEILRCKGPPVMDEEERHAMVDAVKWVDETIRGAARHAPRRLACPYTPLPARKRAMHVCLPRPLSFPASKRGRPTTNPFTHPPKTPSSTPPPPCTYGGRTGVPYDLSPEFIQELFTKHRVDYIIHGDDPCLLPDGSDAYAHAKKLGRFKMIKRTEGVSTTDIVGRMLTCTRSNPLIAGGGGPEGEEGTHPLTRPFSEGQGGSSSDEEAAGPPSEDGEGLSKGRSSRTAVSRFLPPSRRLVQFSNGKTAPPGARTVYIDGAFDCFHPGHVKILAAARAQGDFLLVGVHPDDAVTARRGPHLPIMNVHERSLSVLSCKYVDEIVIGAPTVITDDLIKTFNISLVVRGSVSETRHLGPCDAERYALTRERRMFRELPSPSATTARNIILRIVDNRKAFEARNAKKVQSEEAYYGNAKAYVAEL